MCGDSLGASTEGDLIGMVRSHAKNKHDRDLTVDEARDMAKSRSA
jgi:hypothetical protein